MVNTNKQKATVAKQKMADDVAQESIEEEVTSARARQGRRERKTVYEDVSQTDIPQYVRDAFLQDDWVLRFIRYSVQGNPDNTHLAKRYQEGWEFVTQNELEDYGLQEYLSNFSFEDTRSFKGLLVSGDVVLAKADINFVKSRQKVVEARTEREVASADLHTIAKQKGFDVRGTSSKVTYSEPTFQS